MPPIAIVGAIIGAAAVGTSIYEGQAQATQTKKAQGAAEAAQAKALGDLQTAQQTASTQAQNALQAKRAAATSSQDIFTSPLGLQTQATTAKKQLLGL